MKLNRLRVLRQAMLAAVLLPFGSAGSWGDVPPARNEAFTGCVIYRDADLPPITSGTLVIRDGVIAAMGADADVRVPEGVSVTPCNGGAILPGFWNAHVHFTEPDWQNAAGADRQQLRRQISERYTRYGFVALVDTGSVLANTRALAERVRRELGGPDILTAGAPFVAPNGTPFYVEDFKFPELADAEQARSAVGELFDNGADAVKLMTVSLTRQQPFPSIPLEAVKAVAETAHARGKRVLAHPTNRDGVERAIEGGVDVLLHTAPIGGPWEDALVKRMVAADMALVPTLALWDYEAAKTQDEAVAKRFREVSAQQLAAFAKAGGRVLFGTDVGYMTLYDPTPEYVAMQAAGMTFRQILVSLTSAPADVFAKDLVPARLAAGGAATFVMTEGDPATDIRRLAQVRRTYIRGVEVYTRHP